MSILFCRTSNWRKRWRGRKCRVRCWWWRWRWWWGGCSPFEAKLYTFIFLLFFFNNPGFNTPNENVFALVFPSLFFGYLWPLISIVTRVGFSGDERLRMFSFLLLFDNLNGKEEAFSIVGPGVKTADADPFLPLELVGLDKREDVGANVFAFVTGGEIAEPGSEWFEINIGEFGGELLLLVLLPLLLLLLLSLLWTGEWLTELVLSSSSEELVSSSIEIFGDVSFVSKR